METTVMQTVIGVSLMLVVFAVGLVWAKKASR